MNSFGWCIQVEYDKIELVFYGVAEGRFAMIKRLVALMTVACLSVAPMSVLAEETDYSYLEEMSVKELKELRDAINEILGDSNSATTTETEFPEKDMYGNKLSVDEEPYKHVIKEIKKYRDDLYNPFSFELYNVKYYKSLDYIMLDYASTDESGVSLRKAITIVCDDNDSFVIDSMYPSGDPLNVDFINAHLE